MEEDLISIIIPMYNASKYITPLLDSIKNQTYKNYEVIIVNDCSVDNSTHVVHSYIYRNIDMNINILYNSKNLGVSYSRNIGLEKSKGKYILFADNDDLLEPNTLEVFHKYAKEYNADIVHTHSHFRMNDKNEKIAVSFERNLSSNEQKRNPYVLINNIEDIMEQFLNVEIDWNVWGKLYKREFLINNNIKFIEGVGLLEDLLFNLKCLLTKNIYLMIPDVLYFYRVYKESTLRTMSDDEKYFQKMIRNQIYGMMEIKRIIDKFNINEKHSYSLIKWGFNVYKSFSHAIRLKSFSNNENEYFRGLIREFGKYFKNDNIFIACLFRFANK